MNRLPAGRWDSSWRGKCQVERVIPLRGEKEAYVRFFFCEGDSEGWRKNNQI
jgi:hypothetical protein